MGTVTFFLASYHLADATRGHSGDLCRDLSAVTQHGLVPLSGSRLSGAIHTYLSHASFTDVHVESSQCSVHLMKFCEAAIITSL